MIKLKIDTKNFDDKLGRELIAINYVNFINILDGHHVVALDAPWGSGKSTIINYMSKHFKKNEDVFVEYNAWENDYTEEPLLSLMSDIHQQFKDKEYVGTDEWKSFVSHMLKATKLFTQGTLKGLSKMAMGDEATKDLSDACLTIAGTVTEEIADNLFKDIDESKKSRKKFKDELKNYTNKILEEKSKKKLIIIIDELDRCRPTFAIELLENIKHLFDIENIVFLIAVDTTQLAESIKAVYGNGFDANTYLHRFFDLNLLLPRETLSTLFTEILTSKFNEDDLKYTNYQIILPYAIKFFNISIRDFQKIVIETYLLFYVHKKISNIGICIYFLIIKYKEPDVYNIIFQNQNSLFQDIKSNIETKYKVSETLSKFLMAKDIPLFENGYYSNNATKTLNAIGSFFLK